MYVKTKLGFSGTFLMGSGPDRDHHFGCYLEDSVSWSGSIYHPETADRESWSIFLYAKPRGKP